MKTNIIGFKEFREASEKYISRINNGESFTILRRSKPIFKITPIEDEEIWETVADFSSINPKGISAYDLVKALRKK